MKWYSLLFNFFQIQDFIFSTCRKYNIDYSHNFHHSYQVLELADCIGKRDYILNHNQKTVLQLSCLLHDMCNIKYTNYYQSIIDTSNFMIKDLNLPYHIHDGVLNIISTINYSKFDQSNGNIIYPSWIKTDSKYRDVFHITRESDLLTSYDIKRLIHYKHDHLGITDFKMIKNDIIDTANNKILKHPLDLYISPTAKKIATIWQKEMLETINNLNETKIREIWYDIPITLPEYRDKIQKTINQPLLL